ncbi:MAG: hypothetical protein ACKOYC_01855 [Bacteroidota bacterium]
MKIKNRILFSAIIAITLPFASCKKDDDSNNGGGGGGPYPELVFSADINGIPWKAETDTVNFFIASPDCGLAYGTGASNVIEMYLHMEGSISAGLGFPLSQNGNSQIEMYNGFDYFVSTSGMATITEFNPTTRSITMTFSATLDNGSGNVMQITNGLLKKRPYFGPYSTNSMTANINGVPINGLCTPTTINAVSNNSILTFSNNPQADIFFALIVPNNCVAGESYQVGDLVVGSSIFNWTTASCPGNSCNYTFILTDKFGDGWNGAEMEIRQGSNVFATLGPGFTNGYTLNQSIALQSNKNYSLVFTNGGMYPSEVGVVVIDQNGSTLFNTDLDNGADMMFTIGPYEDYHGHGSINITNHNTSTNKISGTFSYQGEDINGNPYTIDGATSV